MIVDVEKCNKAIKSEIVTMVVIVKYCTQLHFVQLVDYYEYNGDPIWITHNSPALSKNEIFVSWYLRCLFL